jgi:hypothetical protein
MSNLNNNTTQLEALLAKINALPEAGGSSGGGRELEIAYISDYYVANCINVVFENGWTWDDYIKSKYNQLFDRFGNPFFNCAAHPDGWVNIRNTVLTFVSTDGTSGGMVRLTDTITPSAQYIIFDDD